MIMYWSELPIFTRFKTRKCFYEVKGSCTKCMGYKEVFRLSNGLLMVVHFSHQTYVKDTFVFCPVTNQDALMGYSQCSNMFVVCACDCTTCSYPTKGILFRTVEEMSN